MKAITLFWHRRDLRHFDNAGLYHALKENQNVQPVFIFDTSILDQLEDKNDQRVAFIYDRIVALKKVYQQLGSDLWVLHGKPLDVFSQLIQKHNVQAVYFNKDYEPYARERDKSVYELLQKHNIACKGFKDHVIFEMKEIVKEDGLPYTVFTPYSKKWLAKLNDFYLKSYPVEKHSKHFNQGQHEPLIEIEAMGFGTLTLSLPSEKTNENILANYAGQRDIPSVNGTSKLSVHLRFGTISIRQLANQALDYPKFLNELIWRDFYQMILFFFPHSTHKAFKPKYDLVDWVNNENHFKKWCEGKTGYPIVDAGMRELNATGYMHNRVRMIVASFLTKHLLIDWRWGEAYFAKKLMDYDQASNVGGWQWAASSGCDAAPYFRVFNPALQTEKFDPEMKYIKKWILELGTSSYPKPIVDHAFARERVLQAYKKALTEEKE